MNSVAIFAGTSDGRQLAEYLAKRGVKIQVFVATGYGKLMHSPDENLSVGPMDADEITRAIKESGHNYVIDATHPYAVNITNNIKSACKAANLQYLRLVRGEIANDEGVFYAEDFSHAADILRQSEGNILLTVGSRRLEAFSADKELQKRLYVRILPDAKTIENCIEMGFLQQNLICMQGPFTHDVNAAMIQMLDIRTVVTKDSGDAGGVQEKISAAKQTGAKLLVVKRPGGEEGLTYGEMLDYLAKNLKLGGCNEAEIANSCRFPVFIDLKNKPVLVVGGGKIACRRVKAMLLFGADITVVAPGICDELRQISGEFTWKNENYTGIDKDYFLALAATNERQVNEKVGKDAAKRKILASICDDRHESTFWFPAIIREDGIIAGLISDTADHKHVKITTERIKRFLKERI